jgi:RNA polymerase sigma factor (sigma-70 family)
MDDHDLLRQYVQSQSQDAFRQIVERHLPMVYATARRMVFDAHLAEEVAQNVFTTLAQKAESLRPPQVTAGWLYNTTRNLALHAVRGELRRREREQTAVAMQALESEFNAGQINENLEPAMAELAADDRDTLVLRFFEDRSLLDVGRELGISEDAARMRVNRALDRLRTIFNRKGVTVSSAVLATAITAGTSSAVPAGLGTAITAAALAGTTIVTTATFTQTILTTMSWINAKSFTAIIAAAALAGTGTYYVQKGRENDLQAENQRLTAEQDKLTAEHNADLVSAQAGKEELERLHKDLRDLPRLRNEVAQLKRQRDEVKPALSTQPAKNPGLAQLPTPEAGAGRYLSSDQLANVGHATPEAGLQTITWAMIKGTFDDVNKTVSPELLGEELKNPDKARAQFEQSQKKMAPLFKGMQIVARKVLAEDKVELKIKMDADPIPGSKAPTPPYMVQPMVKVGDEWKLGGSTREHKPKWDEDGQIVPLSP